MSEKMLRGHTPRWSVPVDEEVGGALGCKFGGGDGEYIRTADEMVGEEQDVGVTPRRDR